VLVKSLLVAGVLVLPLPALVLGVPGVARHRGLGLDDKLAFGLLVALRALILLVLFALSGVTLLVAIGAMVRHLEDLPSLVYTFVVLDLLLAALVLLTFGRRDRRPARRRATPAAR
jgi:hypothetical protein